MTLGTCHESAEQYHARKTKTYRQPTPYSGGGESNPCDTPLLHIMRPPSQTRIFNWLLCLEARGLCSILPGQPAEL